MAPGDQVVVLCAARSAGEEALEVLLDVLAGFGPPDARVVDAARALRSALNGFVTLEGASGFGIPRDVTPSFRFLSRAMPRSTGARAADRARASATPVTPPRTACVLTLERHH
ncbi:TetR-like C-terminal domain-containing protein [Streptomyces sp. NPDC006617]|uniref:TetR-like C-terminal domain-containing protein n=1 Tax=Streptomyces sp. NPDC006617 TaxID=3155354 RepID=UPI00339E7089